MGRYLVVANQTLGGEKLDRTIRDRIARGHSAFYIVVPLVVPKHETADWSRGFTVVQTSEDLRERREEDARQYEAKLREARRRAERRLDQMIERIQSAGGEADGKVGDADPEVAVKEALQGQTFDEVILSTLPTGISRWVKLDVPSRVARIADVPVTTVEAEQ